MDILRDLLDQQVIDCTGEKSGKVDGIAIDIRAGAPPRVAYLDIGPEALARRFSSRLARFIAKRRKPYHVSWSAIERIDVSVNLSVDATRSAAFDLEAWVRDHIITKIPGNAHQKHQEKND